MDNFSAYILKKSCIFLVFLHTSNQPRRIPLRNYALVFIDTKKYLDRKDTETRNRLFSASLKNLDPSFENYPWALNAHLRAGWEKKKKKKNSYCFVNALSFDEFHSNLMKFILCRNHHLDLFLSQIWITGAT